MKINSPPVDVVKPLDADDIHVWQLAYDRRHGRAPLLAVLAAYLACPVEAIVLKASAYGRPVLAMPRGQMLCFNWSHSGNRALIALARGIEPGIDVERLRAHPRALSIARRYFSPEEALMLEALPADRQNRAFLELWTAKEAVLKALGRGLAFGLHRLSVTATGQGFTLNRLDGYDVNQWQLHGLALGDDYVGALAWQGGPGHIRWQTRFK